MKNFLKQLLVAVCVCMPALAGAQQPLPETLDPAIRMGKLDNGLTYYICHNELPADRVEFYIAQRVGSILEEDHQRGLAHFLEHMAFNGTKNFPGKNLINYLEKNGVKFGANLNAYTSIDETVYNISDVPAREGLIDSCLLILHDWASAIALEETEIDAERKVIHEEWRTRNSASQRMTEKILPILYPNGNRYGHRMPIGTMEVVDNFPYQAIRDYYHKWYRPDLQGIIVVGDVDVDRVEAKIKELWQDVPAPVNAAVREYIQIPDNDEPVVAIVSDKESQTNMLRIMYKLPVKPDGYKMTFEAEYIDMMRVLISVMINTRYTELLQVENPPFLSASVGKGDYMYSPTREAFVLATAYKTGAWNEALDALVKVAKQAYMYGFTQGEMNRAVAEITSLVEKSYNERGTQKNEAFVNKALDHFLHKTPQMSEETAYALYTNLLSAITLDAVNAQFRTYFPQDGRNTTLLMMGEENENSTVPTEEQLLAAYNDAWRVEVEAYTDDVEQRPLIAELPAKGSIVKEKENKVLGATEYYLSNGAKVIIKSTDFKADEISMQALSDGGTSLFDVAERPTYTSINSLVSMGGMGDFSAMELGKQLSGVQANISAKVSTYGETISGNCSVKDFETFLQLVYLRFTTTRVDSARFLAWKGQMSNGLKLAEADPQRPLADTVSYLSYGNHERVKRFSLDDLDKVDYVRALEMFTERVNNAADFTFIFVGNIDKEVAKPLIEQYIASLPSTGKHEKPDYKVMPKKRTGYREAIFDQTMESPQTSVIISYDGKVKDNLRNRITMSILSQVMRVVYTETIREQEGGTYGVSTSGSVYSTPRNSWSYDIMFNTNTEMSERLATRTIEELQRVATEGPSVETFDKVKAYMEKSYQSRIKENGYWMSTLSSYYTTGRETFSTYLETLDKVTPDDVRKMAERVVKSKDMMKVIRMGVPAENK